MLNLNLLKEKMPKPKPKTRVGTAIVGPKFKFNKSVFVGVAVLAVAFGGYFAVKKSHAAAWCKGVGWTNYCGTTIYPVSPWNGLHLDADANSRWNGGKIQQWQYLPSDVNQGWNLYSNDGTWFLMQNIGSHKCLDFDINTNYNGGHVQQWDCNSWANQRYGNQEFQFVWGYGWSAFRNKWNGKCIDFDRNQSFNGAKVQQWDCNWWSNQQFRF